MATNFLEAAGTNGFIATPFTVLTTGLNALASGSATGTSSAFTQTNNASAIWGSVYFTSGGTFTPSAGQALLGWFLPSPDGGTSFEATLATASTSVPAVSRAPDFVVPLDNAAYASGSIRWCQGRFVQLPWENYKVIVQSTGTTALPATGNTISVGPVAIQY